MLAPGFHEIPEADYHAQTLLSRPALSASIAKILILKSPLHAWHCHPKFGAQARTETDEMDFGSIAHALILGKGGDKLAVCEHSDWRQKEAQAFREDARASGMIPVKRSTMEAVMGMVTTFESQVRAMCPEFYADGALTEQCAIWEARGILCQSMFDRLLLSNGHIYDVKTTGDANPDAISRQIVKMGYDIQSAFYCRAVETLYPRLAGRTRFTFLFVESAPPHAVTPVELDGEAETIGGMKIDRAFETWAACLETGNWRGYVTETATVSLPAYALADELAKSAPEYEFPKTVTAAAATDDLFDF